jgi:hypothetical protein
LHGVNIIHDSELSKYFKRFLTMNYPLFPELLPVEKGTAPSGKRAWYIPFRNSIIGFYLNTCL